MLKIFLINILFPLFLMSQVHVASYEIPGFEEAFAINLFVQEGEFESIQIQSVNCDIETEQSQIRFNQDDLDSFVLVLNNASPLFKNIESKPSSDLQEQNQLVEDLTVHAFFSCIDSGKPMDGEGTLYFEFKHIIVDKEIITVFYIFNRKSQIDENEFKTCMGLYFTSSQQLDSFIEKISPTSIENYLNMIRNK